MIVEVKLKRDEIKEAIKAHVGRTFDLNKLASADVVMDAYGSEARVILKDHAQVAAEEKAREADRTRLAKQDEVRSKLLDSPHSPVAVAADSDF